MTTQDEESTVSDGLGKPSRRAKRPLYWGARVCMLVLGAPFVMAAIAALMLIGREVAAPTWIVRDVEQRAATVLAGGQLTFGSMNVTLGHDLHPRLVLKNAVLLDAGGALLARVPQIDVLVSPRGALQGRVLVQMLSIEGAQLSLFRDADGSVALSFEQGAAPVGAGDTVLDLLAQLDAVFDDGALEALEEVRADGLIINYSDAQAGRSWIVDGGQIALDLRDNTTALRANVSLLSGRSFVSDVEFTYARPRGALNAELGLRLSDVPAADLASQAPALSWLSVLDAPISGAMRGRLDAQGVTETVSATLQIGAGSVQPNAATRPIPFDHARTYLTYSPARAHLSLDLIEIESDWASLTGSGQTYLRDIENGQPQAFVGQLEVDAVDVAPDALLDAPVALTAAMADYRLRLDPFRLEIGQAVLMSDTAQLRLSGQVDAEADGWAVALDLETDEIPTEEILGLWPRQMTPRSRAWISNNISGGAWHNVNMSVRTRPGRTADIGLTGEFDGLDVQFMQTLPPISEARGVLSIGARRLAVSLDAGAVNAPQGGPLNVAGSSFVIPRLGIPNPPAQLDLAARGQITAAAAVLDLAPFEVFRKANLPVSFAEGRAEIAMRLDMPLGDGVPPEARIWQADALLRNVRSAAVMPGRLITGTALRVTVDPEALVVQGPVRMDDIGADITFSRALGQGSEGTARLSADLRLTPTFLDTFNIALPDGMVRGGAAARLNINLADAARPTFELTSNLRGLGLSLAGLDWSKVPGTAGSLNIAGQLGASPRIDQVSLSAPGLSAQGDIRLNPSGGLDRATFDRLQVGDWFDAPLVLVGRGDARPPAIQIAGGSLDLRGAGFRSGNGDGRAAGGPIDIVLDRLQVTQSIALEDFRAALTPTGGLQGTFSGSINGQAPITGSLVPIDGRAAVRIISDDAGAVVRAAGLLRNAYSGTLDLTLLPTGAEGSYDGTLTGQNVRVRDAPALASLLDAVSVVGLLSQLDGQGLLFTDVDARFRLTPDEVIIAQSSAFGPGLGLSMDGVVSTSAGTIDMQGVLSPFYALNGIGSVLTRPGEGLIGFNFTLRGDIDSPRVGVNPLSALTPGMFREIFRRPPPVVGN